MAVLAIVAAALGLLALVGSLKAIHALKRAALARSIARLEIATGIAKTPWMAAAVQHRENFMAAVQAGHWKPSSSGFDPMTAPTPGTLEPYGDDSRPGARARSSRRVRTAGA